MSVVLKKRRILRLGRRQEGAAAVEFALCLIPLLLILGGIVDLGQAWYMESVLSTASRAGARYATRYELDNNGQPIPAANRDVSDYLTNKYAVLLPDDAHFEVTLGGTADQVSITVQAEKHWLILGSIVPGLTNPQTLSSTTWMTSE